MRRAGTVVALLALGAGSVALAACGGGNEEDEAAAASLPTSVTIKTQSTAISIGVLDNLFTPGQINVKVGDEVNWDWDGRNSHSVVGTFEGTAIDSGQKSGNNRFTFKFEKAGTFEYQCGVHGASMPGKVIVQ